MTRRSILLSSASKGKIHESKRRSVQFNKYVQTAIEDKLGNVSYCSKRLSRPASSTNFVRSTSAMLRGSFGGKRRGIGNSNNTYGSQSTNGSDRNNSLCSSASTIVEHIFEKSTMNAARWGSSKIASSVSISTDSYDSPLRPTSIRVAKTSTSKDTEHFNHMDNDFYFTVLNDTANKNVFDEDEDPRVMHQKQKKEEILSSLTLSIQNDCNNNSNTEPVTNSIKQKIQRHQNTDNKLTTSTTTSPTFDPTATIYLKSDIDATMHRKNYENSDIRQDLPPCAPRREKSDQSIWSSYSSVDSSSSSERSFLW